YAAPTGAIAYNVRITSTAKSNRARINRHVHSELSRVNHPPFETDHFHAEIRIRRRFQSQLATIRTLVWIVRCRRSDDHDRIWNSRGSPDATRRRLQNTTQTDCPRAACLSRAVRLV